jgi:hypothetical protein
MHHGLVIMFALVEQPASSPTALVLIAPKCLSGPWDRPDASKVPVLSESLHRRNSYSSPQNKFHVLMLKLHSDSSRQSSRFSNFQLHQAALDQPIARAPAAFVLSARPQ